MRWIFGLLCLIFLIIFHEFGHFLAAKLFGVKVESFSVGFGPVLLHKKIKGTDYRLSLIPLGGYCGMKGEKDFQKAINENLPEINAEPDSLYGIHPLKRALIGFAGPFFNFIFAVIASSIMAGMSYKYYVYSNQILVNDKVTSQVAKNAGIISGDKIISINHKKTEDFSDLIEQISLYPDKDILVEVDRNGQILTFNLHTELDKETGTGKIGIAADTSNTIEKIKEKYSFFPAIYHGFCDTFNTIKIIFKSFSILFKGVNLDNVVSGPVRTTDLLGSTVQEGFSVGIKEGFLTMLELLSIISISLFIMNLLPIPILDGGIILVAFIEIVIRRKLNPKIQYYIQFIGLAFILLLFIIGIKGDLKFYINRGK